MKKYLVYRILCVLAFSNLAALSAFAQQEQTIYLLPDNQPVSADKLDSVRESWGGGKHLLFSHNEEDDKKHVIHLIRATDEMLKKYAEEVQQLKQVTLDMVHHPAPEWTAQTLDGHSISLSDLRGKVVVMNFWFTTCPPCIQEMPHLNDLAAKYKNVVFIACSFNENTQVHDFLKTHRFDYRQIPNSKTIDSLYKIHFWPTSFVIDKTGIIQFVSNYDEDIEAKLSSAIEANL